MKKIFCYLTIFAQAVCTFILLVFIYMVFALLESDLGFDGLVGLLLSFVFAIIFALVTIIICFLIGLPIRLNNRLKIWWEDNYLISPVGVAVGLVILIISTLPQLATSRIVFDAAENYGRQITTPNVSLATLGWFLTAFMSLHFNPSRLVKRGYY